MLTIDDINTHSDRWLAWAIKTAKEYYPHRFEAFIEANGFSEEHERLIREAVENK